MARSRGRTGRTAGLGRARTDAILGAALARLEGDRGAGGEFRRRDAARALKAASPRLSGRQVELLTQTLDRMSGVVESGSYGGRILPPKPDVFVEHRHWRTRLRRGEPESAETLASTIREAGTPARLVPLLAEIERDLLLARTRAALRDGARS